MFKQVLILNIILITILIPKISSESLAQREQHVLIDNYLKIFIKRLQLIGDNKVQQFKQLLPFLKDSTETIRIQNETEQFKYELDLLKVTFKIALIHYNSEEKLNFLNNFYKLIKPYFASYLLDELDKQFINQKIRIDCKYLNLMQYDLQEMDLDHEVSYIGFKLKEALREENLQQKKTMYTNIIQKLTPQVQYILDRQPMHKILLKAHLNFLTEYIYTLEEEDIEEFKSDYSVLMKQLEIAEYGTDDEDKLKFLDLFNDVTTKFGRFLKMKFEEYKFKYYEN